MANQRTFNRDQHLTHDALLHDAFASCQRGDYQNALDLYSKAKTMEDRSGKPSLLTEINIARCRAHLYGSVHAIEYLTNLKKNKSRFRNDPQDDAALALALLGNYNRAYRVTKNPTYLELMEQEINSLRHLKLSPQQDMDFLSHWIDLHYYQGHLNAALNTLIQLVRQYPDPDKMIPQISIINLCTKLRSPSNKAIGFKVAEALFKNPNLLGKRKIEILNAMILCSDKNNKEIIREIINQLESLYHDPSLRALYPKITLVSAHALQHVDKAAANKEYETIVNNNTLKNSNVATHRHIWGEARNSLALLLLDEEHYDEVIKLLGTIEPPTSSQELRRQAIYAHFILGKAYCVKGMIEDSTKHLKIAADAQYAPAVSELAKLTRDRAHRAQGFNKSQQTNPVRWERLHGSIPSLSAVSEKEEKEQAITEEAITVEQEKTLLQLLKNPSHILTLPQKELSAENGTNHTAHMQQTRTRHHTNKHRTAVATRSAFFESKDEMYNPFDELNNDDGQTEKFNDGNEDARQKPKKSAIKQAPSTKKKKQKAYDDRDILKKNDKPRRTTYCDTLTENATLALSWLDLASRGFATSFLSLFSSTKHRQMLPVSVKEKIQRKNV